MHREAETKKNGERHRERQAGTERGNERQKERGRNTNRVRERKGEMGSKRQRDKQTHRGQEIWGHTHMEAKTHKGGVREKSRKKEIKEERAEIG